MDWALIVENLPNFVRGVGVTLLLLATSLLGGFMLSIPLSMARVSHRRWLRNPVAFFTYVIRGTPLIVQLFITYRGLAQFEAVRDSVAWPLLRNAWFCAWLAYTVNSTAYTTEIFAGALRATPHGEIEAGRSYGFTPWALYRRILLPSALRRALPQYSNEVIGLMHATAIASTVTLVDITRVARDIYFNHFTLLESFGVAAVLYFALTFSLTAVLRMAERRYLRHIKPQQGTTARA